MGIVFGALGGLMVTLAFAKFENHHKFRWTIKAICLGIGAGLLSKVTGSNLGTALANIVIFALVFGAVGLLIDIIKNQSTSEDKKFITKTISTNTETHNYSFPTKTEFQKRDLKNMPLATTTTNLSKNDSPEEMELVWEIVADEFESTSKKKGLYARCFSETNGDELKAKALYYKIRFEELIQERKLLVAQVAGTEVKDSIELQTVGEGRNGRQALKDDDCFINGYYEKFMMNGYECFDLDNGKAMVITPKRKIVYKNLDALKKAMEWHSKTGIFTGALIEIYL